MEYFALGDLSRYIHSAGEADCQEIIKQLLQAVEVMHSRDFTHRDIKPANILVVRKRPDHPYWHVKLGDFGISKKVDEGSNTSLRTERRGTRSYSAPEVLGITRPAGHKSSTYTNKVDIWSLGCVLFNLASGGEHAFNTGDECHLERYCIGTSPLNSPNIPLRLSSAGHDLLRQMLNADAHERPGASDALRSSWLSEQTISDSQHVLPPPSDRVHPINSFLHATESYTAAKQNTAAGLSPDAGFENSSSSSALSPPSPQHPIITEPGSPHDDSQSPVASMQARRHEDKHVPLRMPIRERAERRQEGRGNGNDNVFNAERSNTSQALMVYPSPISEQVLVESQHLNSPSPPLQELAKSISPQSSTSRDQSIHEPPIVNRRDSYKRGSDLELDNSHTHSTSSPRAKAISTTQKGNIATHEQDNASKLNTVLNIKDTNANQGKPIKDGQNFLTPNSPEYVDTALLSRIIESAAKDEDGATPMHYAAWGGHIAMVDHLRGLGQDIGAKNQYGATAMHYAAWGGHIAMVDHLRGLGQDIGAKDNNGMSVIHSAAWGGHIAMVDHLRGLGQDIGAKDNNGATPMHYAAMEGDIAMVEHLQALGQDIGARDRDGDTPLDWAIEYNQQAMVDYLE